MQSVLIPALASLSAFLSFPMTLSAQDNPVIPNRQITLQEVLSLAMENNLDLKMARSDSAMAREEVLYAKAARTPYLAAGVNYNYIGNPVIYRDFIRMIH